MDRSTPSTAHSCGRWNVGLMRPALSQWISSPESVMAMAEPQPPDWDLSPEIIEFIHSDFRVYHSFAGTQQHDHTC
jgi:hypothetical protein